MKKYIMLFVTITMVLLTSISYAYNNLSSQAIGIKKPSINIDSSKFGRIQNIVWINNFISSDNALIILSSREVNGSSNSYLYYLNIDSGKSNLLSDFPSHKNLDDVILFDCGFSGYNMITAYDRGIVKTGIVRPNGSINSPVKAQSEKVEIDGFQDATSMDCKRTLFYTRAGDNLLYTRKFNGDFFGNFFNNNPKPDAVSYYKKPCYIVNADSLDMVLTYTSIRGNKINLYGMDYSGNLINMWGKPLFKNVVTARGVEDNYGIVGMSARKGHTEEMLDIFMVRQYYESSKRNSYILDSIPYNTDMFGGVPSISSTTFNQDYTLVYTCYDANHKGVIKVCGYNEKPKVIVDDGNIYGHVIIAQKGGGKHILYFTYENNKTKIKICDENGKLIKDISNMIL